MRGATHISHNIQRGSLIGYIMCEVVVKESFYEVNCMLAQYYVDLMMKLGLVRFHAPPYCGAGDCRADGGDHGTAWSG